MRLTVRLLGAEVLHVDTEKDVATTTDRGEATSYPVGFTAPQEADLAYQYVDPREYQ